MTRRGSFLSKSMLANESVQCYPLPNYRRFSSDGNDENLPSYSITLSESQGFLWNQDLFASSYQQSEAGVSSMLSMSDGSYYLNDTGSGAFQADSSHSIVDVIDVVVSENEYENDVNVDNHVFKIPDQNLSPNKENGVDANATDNNSNKTAGIQIQNKRITRSASASKQHPEHKLLVKISTHEENAAATLDDTIFESDI